MPEDTKTEAGTQEEIKTFTQEEVDRSARTARLEGEAKGKRQALATATDQAATDKLAAEKQWKELYEREQAKSAKVESLEAQVKAYEERDESRLKARLKALGDAAKVAVEALPEGMTAGEKLALLDASGLFADGDSKVKTLGTPAGKVKKQGTGKSERPEGYRRSRF